MTRLLAALVALTLPLASAMAGEKTLKAVVHADLKVLDPTWTATYITTRFSYVIYDTLFSYNWKYQPKPQMVESWTTSPDALTWTFMLRPGLVFHDGAPVTSADVIASLKRWMVRLGAGQAFGKFVAGVEAVDPKTFRIVLKEPYGLILEGLGSAATAYIMPEKQAGKPTTEQITESIGSGPFRMVRDQWRPGNKVVFVRHDGYVPRKEPADYMSGGKIPKLDRLEWLYIPDANTALSAMLAGEVDYYEMPPLDFIRIMKDDPNIEVRNIDRLGVQMLLRPNNLWPPFNNEKARQALLHIIDQNEVMGAVVGDDSLYMKFCGAFLLCNSDSESAAGADPLRKPDYDQAKALLKEAGYDGRKVVVLQPTDRPQYNAATAVLIESLRRAGVNVDVQSADWSTISIRRIRKDDPEKGGWNLFITSQGGPDVASPITNIWFNTRCEAANPGWPCDADLDKMVEAWSREPDPAQRRAKIDAIQARAYVSVPYVPMGQYFQPIAYRKNVTGVLDAPLPVYWNIDKK
jgi:peptide/nickel transport system substrate-binding protein